MAHPSHNVSSTTQTKRNVEGVIMFKHIKFSIALGAISILVSQAQASNRPYVDGLVTENQREPRNSLFTEELIEDGLLHESGFFARVDKIDGPDYFGQEPVFRSAYETLKSRYGNDYLPANLPRELHPIRDRIYRYIMKDPDRGIHGKRSYQSGYRGINNPAGFRFWPSQLPTKITRLSYCFGISPRILTALIKKESNFVANAESPTGAVGLMQITAVGGAEVLELLGYPNPYITNNFDATDVFKEYISCYMGEDEPWVDPWRVSESTVVGNNQPVVSPECSTALTNCRRGSKGLRRLRGASATNFDKWITGQIPSGSQDYGLVIGAVLLKYHLGHSGVVKGLQNYNGDTVKVAYSRRIRSDADDVSMETVDFGIFGEIFRVVLDGTNSQLEAFDILEEATHVWEVEGDRDEEVIEYLRRNEIPGKGHPFVREAIL